MTENANEFPEFQGLEVPSRFIHDVYVRLKAKYQMELMRAKGAVSEAMAWPHDENPWPDGFMWVEAAPTVEAYLRREAIRRTLQAWQDVTFGAATKRASDLYNSSDV